MLNQTGKGAVVSLVKFPGASTYLNCHSSHLANCVERGKNNSHLFIAGYCRVHSAPRNSGCYLINYSQYIARQ